MPMQTNPTVTALGATAVVFFSKFAALAAGAPDGAGVPAALDWAAIIEKAGTIGVLVWMVVWFQRRLEAKDAVVQQITQDLIKAVDKLADAQQEVAKSISNLHPK